MRHSRSVKSILPLLLAIVLGTVPGPASGADSGQFMFTLAEPLPVAAGGTLFFRGLAVNQGNVTWAPDKTYIVAEIYDKDRRYLATTSRVRPSAAVPPGGNLPVELKFDVPILYSGDYSFRTFIVHNEQRVAQSDHKSFTATPQAAAPPGQAPRPWPVTAAGNAVLSYRNNKGPENAQLEANVSLSGKMVEGNYEFSANSFFDHDGAMELRNVLFNYHAAYADIGAGDVSPSFSPLSLSGAGVRGGMVKTKEIGVGNSKMVIEAVGAQAAEAVEGSAGSDGTFQRMMYGAQSSFILPGNLTVRGNLLQVDDVQGSLATPGPTLAPARNQSLGGGFSWAPTQDLKFDADWQRSSFEADKTSTAAAVSDSAWRASAGYTQPRWSLTGSLSRNGADFLNLAAPGVARDRFTYEAGLMLRPKDWITLNNNFSWFRDNLEDDAAKTTSRQRTLGTTAEISFPTRTRLTLGLSQNRSYGSPSTTQDNETVGASAGLSQSWDKSSLNVGYQRSDFTDRTGAANDLRTHTVNASYNWNVHPRLSTTFGEALSITHDQKDGSRLRANTLSGSFNGTLQPEKLFLRGSLSFTDTEDSDTVSPSDRKDDNLTVELRWQAMKELGLTMGAFRTASSDDITPANGRISHGITLRTTYTF